MNSEKPPKATAQGSDASLGICTVQSKGMVVVENELWVTPVVVENELWVTPVGRLSRFSFLSPFTYHFQRTFRPGDITHF